MTNQLPQNFVTGPPDFIGWGVQKAGTSWMFSLIARHPNVFIPEGLVHDAKLKERDFFGKFGTLTFNEGSISEPAVIRIRVVNKNRI